jgi:hypothetical protein
MRLKKFPRELVEEFELRVLKDDARDFGPCPKPPLLSGAFAVLHSMTVGSKKEATTLSWSPGILRSFAAQDTFWSATNRGKVDLYREAS